MSGVKISSLRRRQTQVSWSVRLAVDELCIFTVMAFTTGRLLGRVIHAFGQQIPQVVSRCIPDGSGVSLYILDPDAAAFSQAVAGTLHAP